MKSWETRDSVHSKLRAQGLLLLVPPCGLAKRLQRSRCLLLSFYFPKIRSSEDSARLWLEAWLGDPLFDNPIAILPGNPVLGHKMSHLGYARLIRRSYFLFKSLLAESVRTRVFLYLKVSLQRWHCSGLQQPLKNNRVISSTGCQCGGSCAPSGSWSGPHPFHRPGKRNDLNVHCEGQR